MAVADGLEAVLSAKFQVLFPHLDERQRRLLMGAEARVLGHGGIRLVARAAGVSERTVSDGVWELESGQAPLGRVRRPGGGRKKLTEIDPGLVPALLELVEPQQRGDPMSMLRWTTKSTRNLAEELTERGHRVSAPKVGSLLAEQGFSLQGNAKVLEGNQHRDRDAQFRYINERVNEHRAAGDPVVSMDAKKKELVGQFKNAGRAWARVGEPVQVNGHDFVDEELGKAMPYGVYDIGANAGWVTVGTDHDTAAFAVASLRNWYNGAGRVTYPDASRLLITVDVGGSNGYRTRAWKTGLAGFAAETGLEVTVCHFPPGTSKWNAIEHRLFSAITMNWRARPLESHEVVIETISATKNRGGLRVHAELDMGTYPTEITISDTEMDTVGLVGHGFHGEWNYTIHPRHHDGPDDEPGARTAVAVFDRGALADPTLTGITGTALTELVTALTTLAADQPAAPQLRRPGAGRPPKLTPTDQVVATLLHQRLSMPPAFLARLYNVSKNVIHKAITKIENLLEKHGTPTIPAAAHLSTLAGLAIYAAANRP